MFGLTRCHFLEFGFAFLFVGETLLVSFSLFFVVREFGGPNSTLVGENLKSLHPHLVPYACDYARE